MKNVMTTLGEAKPKLEEMKKYLESLAGDPESREIAGGVLPALGKQISDIHPFPTHPDPWIEGDGLSPRADRVSGMVRELYHVGLEG